MGWMDLIIFFEGIYYFQTIKRDDSHLWDTMQELFIVGEIVVLEVVEERNNKWKKY